MSNSFQVKFPRIIVLTVTAVSSLSYGLAQSSVKINRELPNYSSLLISADYNSQTNTFGIVNTDVKQPSFNGYASYYSKHNFDLTVQGGMTMNSDTSYSQTTSELDLMAGYTWMTTEKLTVYPNYTHLWNDRSGNALQRVFSDIVELDAYYTTKYYQPSLTLSYLTGEKNMFYFSVQNSFNFDLEDVPGKNTLLSLGLSLDLNFSDKNFYNSLIYDQWDARDFVYWTRNYTNYNGYPAVEILQYGLEETKNRVQDWVNSNGPYVFNAEYTLSSVDVMLPIFYSVNNFMFSATAFLVIPTTQSDFYDQSTQLILNFGVAYSLNFTN